MTQFVMYAYVYTNYALYYVYTTTVVNHAHTVYTYKFMHIIITCAKYNYNIVLGEGHHMWGTRLQCK